MFPKCNVAGCAGNGEDSTPEDRNRGDRLDIWTAYCQRQPSFAPSLLRIAVPLLAEYAPRVNPQQLRTP